MQQHEALEIVRLVQKGLWWRDAYLQRIASVCFPVNHLHDLFVHRFARLIPITPIVAGSYAALSNEEVFWVVNVLVWASLNAIEDSWLKIDQDCSGDISRVVALVVEDIFAVTAFRRKVF
jgi:hypothetical protein